MANFNEHIEQAKKNLSFLCIINETANSHWDWQVTTCFYTGVHLINGYLAQEADSHFENHTDTLNAINPERGSSKIKVTKDCYLAYRKLFNQSIRSRYLSIHSDEKTNSTYDERVAYLTHDKHLRRAVKNLDIVIDFIVDKYDIHIPLSSLDCIELRGKQLKYFEYKKKVAVG